MSTVDKFKVGDLVKLKYNNQVGIVVDMREMTWYGNTIFIEVKWQSSGKRWHTEEENLEPLILKDKLVSTKENTFEIGDSVWFNDPDDDISSGRYRIEHINGETYSLGDEYGSEVEALEHELVHIKERDTNI